MRLCCRLVDSLISANCSRLNAICSITYEFIPKHTGGVPRKLSGIFAPVIHKSLAATHLVFAEYALWRL